MTFFRLAGMAFLIAIFSGCSSVPRIISEYKIDIQQGNVLTQEMVSQLKPGLTKDQVRFILGTPVLMDMFTPIAGITFIVFSRAKVRCRSAVWLWFLRKASLRGVDAESDFLLFNLPK